MPPFTKKAFRIVASISVLGWLLLCVLAYRGLVEVASSAPPGTIDEYARDPQFQLLNFGVGYLPLLVVVLAVLLVVEWGVLFLLGSAFARTPRHRP